MSCVLWIYSVIIMCGDRAFLPLFSCLCRTRTRLWNNKKVEKENFVIVFLLIFSLSRALFPFDFNFLISLFVCLFVCYSCGPTIGQDMVSRRRILSRSRDDLHLDNFPEEEDDVWHIKEKLYKVRTATSFTPFLFWFIPPEQSTLSGAANCGTITWHASSLISLFLFLFHFSLFLKFEFKNEIMGRPFLMEKYVSAFEQRESHPAHIVALLNRYYTLFNNPLTRGYACTQLCRQVESRGW